VARIHPTSAPLSEIPELARCAPGLELLVLYGSRARGDDHVGSDWDLAYLAEERFDPDALLAQLVTRLGERVDLVDLDRANGLLRYRVAAEGRPLYQSTPDRFERYWKEAVTFWCDIQPVLESAYEEVLARLAR
jgi:predicted nucleotidyltransferase